MTNQPIAVIGENKISILFFNSQPVITLAMMDKVHSRPDGTAGRNFREHQNKLIEGEDYYRRNSSEAKTEFSITAPKGLIILTETGYLLLVKSFTDDLAWQVQRQLVKAYFIAQQNPTIAQLPDPKTKKALPGGLTLEQQDTIKALVKQRAEELPKNKQAGATIKIWSAVKKKFGVPYKEIEPDNFINVISLIGRLPLQGEYIAKDESETKALSLTDVEKLIAERLKNTTAPLPVTGQVFINTRIAFDADHLNDLLKSQSLKITRI